MGCVELLELHFAYAVKFEDESYICTIRCKEGRRVWFILFHFYIGLSIGNLGDCNLGSCLTFWYYPWLEESAFYDVVR